MLKEELEVNRINKKLVLYLRILISKMVLDYLMRMQINNNNSHNSSSLLQIYFNKIIKMHNNNNNNNNNNLLCNNNNNRLIPYNKINYLLQNKLRIKQIIKISNYRINSKILKLKMCNYLINKIRNNSLNNRIRLSKIN